LWLGVAVLVVLRLPWGYCRRCGYNLRVVSPLRPCPECGGENTRS
jgi:predicted Zn-ribbon and HTH transcriptional regulator